MNRRALLHSVARAVLGGMATLLLPRLAYGAASHLAPMLKVVPNSQILESLDGGLSWHVCADLGSAIVIHQLTQQGGQFYLQADFQGHNLVLKSPDGHTWYSSEWAPPSGAFRRTFLSIVGG